MKEELYSKLKTLLKEDKILEVKREIEDLLKQYNALFQQDKAALLEAFTADGDNPNDFEMPLDEFDKKIEELRKNFELRLKAADEVRKNEERDNLNQKKGLIAEFKSVIEDEENIGAAFTRYNTIKEKWDQVGQVPAHTVRELQEEFRHLNEQFFYNIRIYKELLQNDFKKNLEAKNDLILRMKSLLKLEDIKDVETFYKAFQAEWDQIGPTFKEDWEDVKTRFYDISNAIHSRTKEHYKEIRNSYKENLEKKEALVEKVKELLEESRDFLNDWKKGEKAIESIREEWKQIGFATKSKNEEVWREFKEATNQFFEKRKSFFGNLKESQKEISSIKKRLIEEANKLAQIPENKEAFDWKGRSNDFIQLQKKWKDVGASFRGEEQKLWNAFRKECDAFFKAREDHWAGSAEREKSNVASKLELIKKIDKWSPSDSLEKDKEALIEFENTWRSIGFVPKKDVSKIESGFKASMEKAWGKLKLDSTERSKIKFESKLGNLQSNDNAEKSLKFELRSIAESIGKQRQVMNQLENNLGFFKGAKDKSNPLLKNALSELENAQATLVELEEKKKMVNVALRAAQKAEEAVDNTSDTE